MYRSNLACLVTKMKNILQEFITKQKEKKTESEQNLKIPFSFFPKTTSEKNRIKQWCICCFWTICICFGFVL